MSINRELAPFYQKCQPKIKLKEHKMVSDRKVTLTMDNHLTMHRTRINNSKKTLPSRPSSQLNLMENLMDDALVIAQTETE